MYRPAGWSRSARAGLLVVVLVQLALVARLLSPLDDLVSRPIAVCDFSAHFCSALNSREHWRRTGALWGFNPYWMAGFPEGFVELIDAKLFRLIAIVPPGSEALAFNLTILSLLLLPPPSVYVAARLCGRSIAEATGAACGAVIATFAVPISIFFWQAGGISFFAASFLVVPAIAGLGAALCGPGLASGTGLVGGAFAIAATTVHAGALAALAPALLASFWVGRPWRVAQMRDAAILGALLLVPNLPLLSATLKLRPQLVSFDSADFLTGGAQRFLRDWVEITLRTKPGWDHGVGALRALMLLGVIGLGVSFRDRMRPMVGVAAGLVTCLVLSYLAPREIFGRSPQSYRHLLPAAFLLCVPFGIGALRVLSIVRQRRPAGVLVSAVAVGFVLEAAIALLPSQALGTGVDPTAEKLATFLRSRTSSEDRIAVESPLQPQPIQPGGTATSVFRRFVFLPLQVEREFLGEGGLCPLSPQRYAGFAYGRLCGARLDALGPAELRALLDRYAIVWVIAQWPKTIDTLRRFPQTLEPAATIDDLAVFHVIDPQRSRLIEGEGIVHASLDRIEVRRARGRRLVLKYHWLPNLRTIPSLRIEEAPQPGAAVGFIAVYPEGQDEFSIVPG